MGERLVFVTIKDGPTLPSGRPLRRAVVPVDSATTWESFQKVVIKKLRVTQIGSFFTKQGKLVSSIGEVMTVDDLEVEEIKPEGAVTNNQPVTPHRRHVSMDMLSSPNNFDSPMSPSATATGSARRHQNPYRPNDRQNGGFGDLEGQRDADENGKNKSGRTGTQINLLLQKVGLKTAPGLPVTSDGKDSASGGGGGLKRGGSALRKTMTMRKGGQRQSGGGKTSMSLIVAISMLLCFATMSALYYALLRV